jgi:hypothetical protein
VTKSGPNKNGIEILITNCYFAAQFTKTISHQSGGYMSKQYNRVEKKRRRLSRIKRERDKIKAAIKTGKSKS